MKMNNETVDFFELHEKLKAAGLEVHQSFPVERFWLRVELFRHYGNSRKDDLEKAFQWIKAEPVYKWNGMLLCITRSNCHTLAEVKKLYEFLD